TPENAEPLLHDLMEGLQDHPDIKVLFGGTEKVVEVARKVGGFSAYFVGEEPVNEVTGFLLQQLGVDGGSGASPDRGIDKVAELVRSGPDGFKLLPVIRHHFGLPTLERTLRGVGMIAESGLVDVISLATDQNAQEFFFR